MAEGSFIYHGYDFSEDKGGEYMHVVQGTEIKSFLENSYRVYLCGNLQDPDLSSHCRTDGLEIGVSSYSSYTAELPHLHRWNHEYNYVIKGDIKIYVFSEQKEYHLREKDLFEIVPAMGYVSKSLPGTEVLFVKNPGGNDKEMLPLTDRIREWQESWENQMKTVEKDES
jgi:hypothetical protein